MWARDNINVMRYLYGRRNRKEEALYLRFFTQELKMRKFAISYDKLVGALHLKLPSRVKSSSLPLDGVYVWFSFVQGTLNTPLKGCQGARLQICSLSFKNFTKTANSVLALEQ